MTFLIIIFLEVLSFVFLGAGIIRIFKNVRPLATMSDEEKAESCRKDAVSYIFVGIANLLGFIAALLNNSGPWSMIFSTLAAAVMALMSWLAFRRADHFAPRESEFQRNERLRSNQADDDDTWLSKL